MFAKKTKTPLSLASDQGLHCFPKSQRMPLDRSIGQIHLKVNGGAKFVLFVVRLQKFLYFDDRVLTSTHNLCFRVKI